MTNVKYINSEGKEFILTSKTESLILRKGNFHKYSWNAETISYKYGDQVQDFTKAAASYELEIIVKGSRIERMKKLQEFNDAAEHDIMVNKRGKLWFGEYSIECFLLSSSTAPDDSGMEVTVNLVTAYCPYPFWIKEKVYSFNSPGLDGSVDGHDYSFDYGDMDYGIQGYKEYTGTDATVPLEFKLIIHGPVTEPRIVINGNVYEILTNVADGCTLTISSHEKSDQEKSCMLTYPNGTSISVLNYRNREHYIFKPILGGAVNVYSKQKMKFELVLIERRSQPLWI